MDNLIFCLNATVPIFLLMLLGFFFKKTGIFTDRFAGEMNSFVFKIALPVLVFSDLAKEDFHQVWDGSFVLICFGVTICCILISFLLSFFLKDSSQRGEFVQASYRSSAALLGIGFIQNIYGDAGAAPLMIIGAVPLYNIFAVLLLSFLKPRKEIMSRELLLKTLKGIVTNPILIGIFIGICWSLFSIPMPPILSKTTGYLSGLATPMGLMAMGASLDLKKAFLAWKPAVAASILKLAAFCAIFLPVAVKLGFYQDKLVAFLIMLGSPTTISSFVMAKNMGHEGTISSSAVMITTLLCAFTLTGWLYLLRLKGYI